MLAYIMKGEKQELLLHEDYVSLRLRGGAPLFCCCWDLATSTDDYNILLHDIYFVETGHEAKTTLLVNSTALFVVGVFASILTLSYVIDQSLLCIYMLAIDRSVSALYIHAGD